MALIIDLKPEEKVIIGNSIITNDRQRTRLRIEGDAPILREKDTMTEAEATTPSRKLYLTIQNMYLANMSEALNRLDSYVDNIMSIKAVAPHIDNVLNDISIQIIQGQYYKGLKLVQDLMNAQDEGVEPKISDDNIKDNIQSNMEAQLLSQSADQLQELYDAWDAIAENEAENIVSYNKKLWMAFFDGVASDSQSEKHSSHNKFDILSNIIHLYNFIYKRSADIITTNNKEKLKTLIFINRECATALRRF